jgi:hypothetical protein
MSDPSEMERWMPGGVLWAATFVVGMVMLSFQTVSAGSADELSALAPSESGADTSPRKSLLQWPGHQPGDSEEPEGRGHLDPDRPHLPEASTAVGTNRIVLESGYTFTQTRSAFTSQSYPEALLRIGMFADWLEFRIGQNFLTREQSVAGVKSSVHGAQDLYLGAKVALVQQQQYLPEIALIPQMTVPTGGGAVSAGTVLPGLNVDFAWKVIKKRFDIELLIATNRVRGDARRASVELATGLTGVVHLTSRLEAFAEWDTFSSLTGGGGVTGPRHSAVGGFVYFITEDLEIDVRAGVGLNSRADDFLAGAGFAVRY